MLQWISFVSQIYNMHRDEQTFFFPSSISFCTYLLNLQAPMQQSYGLHCYKVYFSLNDLLRNQTDYLIVSSVSSSLSSQGQQLCRKYRTVPLICLQYMFCNQSRVIWKQKH